MGNQEHIDTQTEPTQPIIETLEALIANTHAAMRTLIAENNQLREEVKELRAGLITINEIIEREKVER